MAKPPITDEQIEIIKAVFAETGKIDAAAKTAGVSWSTAQKYAGSRDEYESLRAEKRLTIIERIAVAQGVLIDAMTDTDKLAKASLQEIGVVFGIVTDKGLLMTGQATSRNETIGGDPAARLTPEEMEQAARIRERFAGVPG